MPKPVSVYRVTESGKAKYESVFSGLMNVHRKQDDLPPIATPTPVPAARRTRTQTRRGHAFFSEIASLTPPPTTAAHTPPLHPPCPSATSPVSPVPSASPSSLPAVMSPPIVVTSPTGAGEGAVYVTEVHAPSPSPSPPPMPRVNRFGGRGGFTLLLAAVADRQKVDGVGFRTAATGDDQPE